MQTENDVRQRISAVLAEFGYTQNSFAGGDMATQKRLNRQISQGSKITVETLLDILNTFSDVSAEWLLLGVGGMRKIHGDLENKVRILTNLVGEKDLRIRELEEMVMPEQKKKCRIIKMYPRI